MRITDWTDAEKRLLIRLRESGLMWSQVADRIPGRTERACRAQGCQLRDLDLLHDSHVPTNTLGRNVPPENWGWPQVTGRQPDAHYEDDPDACRPEPQWRGSRYSGADMGLGASSAHTMAQEGLYYR